jgi:hypothetical protein
LRLDLIGQLLDLGRERTDLSLHAVETGLVPSTQTARTRAARARRNGSATTRERFQRADYHLHIDDLLFELLDPLSQSSVT